MNSTSFCNTSSQTLSSTQSALNISDTKSSITLNCSGNYLVEVNAEVTATTAGVITIAMTINGVAIPETVRRQTVVVGVNNISTAFAKFVPAARCCPKLIQIVASTDGTAVGSVTRLSGYAMKV